jgi:hypothetical protein
MILGATFLPNPANTLESWWRNCRALVANSQPRPRYSDIEEVQIARMGSVHAGCPLFPLHLYPSDTTRERPTRAGIERLRHNSSWLELEFANESRIIGIPHGASKIRSYYPWALFIDEAAFVPDAGESYDVAISACQDHRGEFSKYGLV